MRPALDREDTPEMIAACLSCKKPPTACNYCGGPKVRANPRRAPYRRKGFPAELRERALALVAEGYTHREASEAVGVGKSTVSKWAVEAAKRKEKGE